MTFQPRRESARNPSPPDDDLELEARIAIGTTPGVGPLRFKALLDRFRGSAAAALGSNASEIASVAGFGPRRAEATLRRAGVGRRILARCAELGVEALDQRDPRYPAALQEIYDPPPVLFARGRVDAFVDATAVAVVGSRRCTAYGRTMASRLGADLAAAGLLVVSGLARGIDGAAHEGALRGRPDGPATAAVLGCGIDVVYPPEHRRLTEEIAAGGLLLTEFPPGTPPDRRHFPRRNRIISGACRGVIVVEASERSGTRLTVDFAMHEGRDIFAVPGPATSPLSAGPLDLLREGACLCASAIDVLREWKLLPGESSSWPAAGEAGAPLRGDPAQVKLLGALDPAVPAGLEEVCELTGLAAGDALAGLLKLELQGLARQLPGQLFVRA